MTSIAALQQGFLFFEGIFLSSSFPIIRTTHISPTKIYLASPSLANCPDSSAVFRAESINLEISTMMSLPERFAPFCLPHRWLSFSLSPLCLVHTIIMAAREWLFRQVAPVSCSSVLLHYFPKMSFCLLPVLSLFLWPLCGFFLALSKHRFTKALFSRTLRRALHPNGTDFFPNQFLFFFSLEVAQNKFYLGNRNNWKQQGKRKASWQRS